MRALKQAGLAKAAIDTFANGVLNIFIDAVLRRFYEGTCPTLPSSSGHNAARLGFGSAGRVYRTEASRGSYLHSEPDCHAIAEFVTFSELFSVSHPVTARWR